MFIKVRRVFTLGAAVFLLLLFTLPSLYLRDRCEALNGRAAQVLALNAAGDGAGAQAAYEALWAEYDAMRARAELFLDHGVMDDATVPLKLMGVYLSGGDGLSLRAAAAEFCQALECMQAIETGDLRLLL